MWKILKPFFNLKLFLVLFLGLLIRFVFIPQSGFVADVSFWKSWALSALDNGALWTFENTNYNYAPTFIYFLKALAFVYRLFANPQNFNQYWEVHNFLFLIILKIPLIIADTLTAAIIFFFVQKTVPKKSSLPLLAASFYYLNPVIIFKGVYWGQVGTLSAFLISLILFTLLLAKTLKTYHLLFIGALIPLCVLIKLQYVIFIPLILLYLFLNHGYRQTVLALAAACTSFFFINLPLLLVHKFSAAIRLIFISTSWFPFLSLNAYNFWWLVSRGAGFTTHDSYPFFNLGSAKSTGLLLFAVVYLTAILLILKNASPKNLLLSLILTSFGFFMFPTEMHERYLYPIFIFLSLAFPYFANNLMGTIKGAGDRFERNWKSTPSPASPAGGVARGQIPLERKTGHQTQKSSVFLKRLFPESLKSIFFLIFCSIISLLSFYNLHTVLCQNYPENCLPLLKQLDLKNLTIAVSAFNLFLFLLLFLFTLTRLKKLALLPVFILLILLSIKYYQNNKKEVSLTQIPHIYGVQGYGSLGLNVPVSSTLPPLNDAFLSANYFFYRQGFGTHAPSHFVFPLKRRFRRFTSDIGVDTNAGPKASIEFQIWSEGKLLFSSGIMKKDEFPKHVDLSLENVNNIELVVSDTGDGQLDDHANWLNPTIYK